jgi:predicted DNA-binding transcriptional regulator AlpA
VDKIAEAVAAAVQAEHEKAARATLGEYLSAKQLEQLTGTKESTWRYWASLDPPQGPPSFRLGRRRVWLTSDVLRWIAEQRQASA